jgi:hypothetical protein
LLIIIDRQWRSLEIPSAVSIAQLMNCASSLTNLAVPNITPSTPKVQVTLPHLRSLTLNKDPRLPARIIAPQLNDLKITSATAPKYVCPCHFFININLADIVCQ